MWKMGKMKREENVKMWRQIKSSIRRRFKRLHSSVRSAALHSRYKTEFFLSIMEGRSGSKLLVFHWNSKSDSQLETQWLQNPNMDSSCFPAKTFVKVFLEHWREKWNYSKLAPTNFIKRCVTHKTIIWTSWTQEMYWNMNEPVCDKGVHKYIIAGRASVTVILKLRGESVSKQCFNSFS